MGGRWWQVSSFFPYEGTVRTFSMLNKHAGEDVSTRVQIDVNWDDYLVSGKGLHVILQSQK